MAQSYTFLVVKHSEPPKNWSDYIIQFEPIKVEEGKKQKNYKNTQLRIRMLWNFSACY